MSQLGMTPEEVQAEVARQKDEEERVRLESLVPVRDRRLDYERSRATANVINVRDGVGPDAHTTVNAHGGKQSAIPYRFDALDPNAMFAMARVLGEGANKYGKDNWRNIPIDDHLNHLLMHVFAYMAGDGSDDHMSHIMCRAMFAAGVHYTP